MSGLHAQPLLDAAAQSLFVVQAAQLLQNLVLMRLVLVAARVHLRDQCVEVRVGAQRALGHQLLPAGGALFIPAAESEREAMNTEAVLPT